MMNVRNRKDFEESAIVLEEPRKLGNHSVKNHMYSTDKHLRKKTKGDYELDE